MTDKPLTKRELDQAIAETQLGIDRLKKQRKEHPSADMRESAHRFLEKLRKELEDLLRDRDKAA